MQVLTVSNFLQKESFDTAFKFHQASFNLHFYNQVDLQNSVLLPLKSAFDFYSFFTLKCK